MIKSHQNVKPIKSLDFRLASSTSEIIECQKLRYQIFAEECGANIFSNGENIDKDKFDDICEHLYVRDVNTNQIVAYTRILDSEVALNNFGFYSQTEFIISDVLNLPGKKLEIGRTCVHSEYRRGSAIITLWLGLVNIMNQRNYEYLFGCASIPLDKDIANIRNIYKCSEKNSLVEPHINVFPINVLPDSNLQDDLLNVNIKKILPPLLKAYLNLGGKICGKPALDKDFNVADLFILLKKSNIQQRYIRKFKLKTNSIPKVNSKIF